MDITCITALSSSSSSSAPFFRDDSSNSTSLLTPDTLREHCSGTFRRSPSPSPSSYAIPITPKVYEKPYFTHQLHERQLTLTGNAIVESDIADQLHLAIPSKPLPVPKGHIGPHLNNLPRRRGHARVAKPVGAVDITPQLTLAAVRKVPRQDECRCLQELVPGLFVAFEDDQLAFGHAAAGGSGERLKTYSGEDFTHIISLSTEKGAEAAMVRGASAEAHLRLVIPAAQDAPDDEDDFIVKPVLSRPQLLAARAFLSATNIRLSPTAYSQSADVRILITTPRNHRVDAMAIASCFLSFASGNSVRRVLAHFDDKDRYLSVWQGIMDCQAWDFVESVARK